MTTEAEIETLRATLSEMAQEVDTLKAEAERLKQAAWVVFDAAPQGTLQRRILYKHWWSAHRATNELDQWLREVNYLIAPGNLEHGA